MFVTNRRGEQEAVSLEKVQAKLARLSSGLSCDHAAVAKRTVSSIQNGTAASEIYATAASIAAEMTTSNYDFYKLAGRILVDDLRRDTCDTFSGYVCASRGLFKEDFVEYVRAHARELDELASEVYDQSLTYLAASTYMKTYLTRDGARKIVERPCYLLLRVAVAIHYPDMERIRTTAADLYAKRYIHATPTLFAAGMRSQQLASCFLLTVKDDISEIFDAVKQCAVISKGGGGVGFDCSDVRAKGSGIKGTGGTSNGVVPMLKVFCDTSLYIDQGGNKRPGSFCAYLNVFHRDIYDFLELRKPQGSDDKRARALFLSVVVNDVFMRRVEADERWTLFCPTEALLACGRSIADLHGADFEAAYEACELAPGKGRVVRARDLWNKILESQAETGCPFLYFADAANEKSNQRHLGTTRCSNLCCEIIEYSGGGEVAVCNLASVVLSSFVARDKTFDFGELDRVTRSLVVNLNRVIDRSDYPVPEAERSNARHRPVAIGVQGFADALVDMGLAFEDPETKAFNSRVFEQIYYSAMSESVRLAREAGAPYASFEGSPLSEGKFQFDLWPDGGSPTVLDWKGLREEVRSHGAANSLLVGLMPTASTSQINDASESTEPITSTVFLKKLLAGEFLYFNPRLQAHLQELRAWSPELASRIVAARGDIQGIEGIPERTKVLFKTVWQVPGKTLVDLASDRARFVCQSQSLNLYVQDDGKISSALFYAWRKGLKTVYYRRNKPAATALNFECLSCSA